MVFSRAGGFVCVHLAFGRSSFFSCLFFPVPVVPFETKKQNKKQKNIMRLPNTLNILTGRKLAGKLKEDIMKEVVVQLGDVDSILAVQIGYEIVRVTFCSDEAFSRAKSMEGVSLFGLWCKILGGGPATTLVHVFDYPFEESDVEIEHALADFGEVKKVRKQTYLSSQQIYTGTRLVSIVLRETPPRSISIDGYHCRIWYRGQPIVCNLCSKQGHVSANCPNKDKCRLCGQSGHFARSCPNPWGGSSDADSVGSSALSVSDFPHLTTGPSPGGAPAGLAVVERLSDDGSNDGNADDENADDENADDVSSPLGPSPMEDEVVPSAVTNGAASSPGVANEPLVVSVSDRSEKGGIVNDIESTVIKESKVSVSTVVESELLDHGNDLQSNVTENGNVNVVGNNVSDSLQNGVIENERIPDDDDDDDAVIDDDFDVSNDAKGITNRKRKLSTDSEDNINEGSAKVGNISLESESDLSCEAGSPTPSPSVLDGDVVLVAETGVSLDVSASAESLDSSLLEDGQRTDFSPE